MSFQWNIFIFIIIGLNHKEQRASLSKNPENNIQGNVYSDLLLVAAVGARPAAHTLVYKSKYSFRPDRIVLSFCQKGLKKTISKINLVKIYSDAIEFEYLTKRM